MYGSKVTMVSARFLRSNREVLLLTDDVTENLPFWQMTSQKLSPLANDISFDEAEKNRTKYSINTIEAKAF